MRRFSGMSKYSAPAAWTIASSFIGQIALAIVAGHFLLTADLSVWTVGGMALLAIFIGTRFRALNNIVHECSHSTFTVDRKDNVMIGSLCASMVLSCFQDYRDEHLTHHAHLGDYDHDLDLQGIRDLKLHEPLTRASVLRHLSNPFLGRHLPYYLGVNLSGRDGQAFRWMKILLLLATAVFTAFLPLTGLLFIIVPFVFVYSTINYWTDCFDHAGLVSSDDDLDSSRNVLAPYPLRVLLFPRHDCFHLVHHLFPQVPARYLQASHEALIEDEIYQEKHNATRPALVFKLPESEGRGLVQDVS